MKKIAIIMGGYSSEYKISLTSGNVVYKNLDITKFKGYRIHIFKEKWVYVDDNDTVAISCCKHDNRNGVEATWQHHGNTMQYHGNGKHGNNYMAITFDRGNHLATPCRYHGNSMSLAWP